VPGTERRKTPLHLGLAAAVATDEEQSLTGDVGGGKFSTSPRHPATPWTSPLPWRNTRGRKN